jgi:branched-chain amino acid transport system substrate-binding protein
VECIRQLVEQDKVLCTFNTLGTPCNTAIHKYMNQKKVPMLFVATGASKWGNPKEFPWTMGYQPDYHTEGVIYAKHILANIKEPKIGVLMQNDDYGKDYFNGFKEGLGKDANRIVKHVTYETTDPTVDSQVIQLKDSGANVFFDIAIPKFAAQSMRKAGEIGWKAAIYLNNVSSSVASAMKPAGFENVQGVITAQYLMDPTDKQWDANPDMKMWVEWMKKSNPGASLEDASNVFAYSVSSLMHETLKKCGDNLTRENLMRQAANHQKLKLPLLLPGITVNTSATDYYPIQAVQLSRFKGETWELFGDVMHAESS